jgi:hypothetical protein
VPDIKEQSPPAGPPRSRPRPSAMLILTVIGVIVTALALPVAIFD